MKRLGLILLAVLSFALAAISTLWLVFFILSLTFSGGRYGYTDETGIIHCGVPFFDENWLWISFEFFVVPFLIAAASVRTIVFCRKHLS